MAGHHYILAGIMTFFLHSLLTTSIFEEMGRISENIDAVDESIPLSLLDDGRIFVLYKTNISYEGFLKFSDNKTFEGLTNYQSKLRKALSLYLADSIEYTQKRPVNKDMHHTRHYYGYKAAKDFLILAQTENDELWTLE